MTYPPSLPGNARIAKAYAKGTVQIKVSQLAVWITKFAEAHQGDPALMALYHSAAAWLERCMKSCGADQHTRIAAPVLKRAESEIRTIELIRIDEIGPNPSTSDAWAAWFVYFDAIISDVTILWEGGKSQCWTSLGNNIELIARRLLSESRDPDSAERAGARIYERAMEVTAWA